MRLILKHLVCGFYCQEVERLELNEMFSGFFTGVGHRADGSGAAK